MSVLPRLLRPRLATRAFSTTAPALLPRRRPTPPSLIPADPDAPKPIKDYNREQHVQQLLELYTPAQVSALLAGEAAIPTKEFNNKRVHRREGDPMALRYLSDLSEIDPILDLPPPNAPKYIRQYTEDGWVIPQHDLPKIQDPNLHYAEADQEGDMYKNLAQVTGMPLSQLKSIQTRSMVVHG